VIQQQANGACFIRTYTYNPEYYPNQ
jgi:hypothetical protein